MGSLVRRARRRFPGTLIGLGRAADKERMRRFRPGTFELVALALLAATVADAISTSRGWHGPDLARFAAAGGTMLSGGWAHTFHNPWVQAGPLELPDGVRASPDRGLVTGRACDRGRGNGVPCADRDLPRGRRPARTPACVRRRRRPRARPSAGRLHDRARRRAGRRDPLASRRAPRARRTRRDRGAARRPLGGLRALGCARRHRPRARALRPVEAVLGAAVAGATAALLLAPFALAGDFHMFAFQWFVAGGPIHVLVGVGHPFGWPFRLLQSGATVGLGGGLALLIRRSPASIFVVPAATTAVRLLLDPLGLFYYWDPVILLALLAAATAFVRRDALRAWVRSAAAPAAPGLRGRLGLAPAAEHEAAEGEAEPEGADREPADRERPCARSTGAASGRAPLPPRWSAARRGAACGARRRPAGPGTRRRRSPRTRRPYLNL